MPPKSDKRIHQIKWRIRIELRKAKILLKLEFRRLFCPRRARRNSRKTMDRVTRTGRTKNVNDRDLWVQRLVKSIDGSPIYYWQSFGTGRCVMFEPPSGSSYLVYLDELDTKYAHLPALKDFALGPLDRPLHEIETTPSQTKSKYDEQRVQMDSYHFKEYAPSPQKEKRSRVNIASHRYAPELRFT